MIRPAKLSALKGVREFRQKVKEVHDAQRAVETTIASDQTTKPPSSHSESPSSLPYHPYKPSKFNVDALLKSQTANQSLTSVVSQSTLSAVDLAELIPKPLSRKPKLESELTLKNAMKIMEDSFQQSVSLKKYAESRKQKVLESRTRNSKTRTVKNESDHFELSTFQPIDHHA
jgi:hypothetical protein